MPALGVSLHNETLEALKNGKWIRLEFQNQQDFNGLVFSALLFKLEETGGVNLIREIKGYWWGKEDTPIKRDDHALDELRYFIMSRPKISPPKQEPTTIEKDKDRLFRALKKNRG